jgi:phosphohistidine phosphatase
MKTAFLLRHADAEIDSHTRDDCDRRLTPQGQRAADLMGRHLASRIQNPILVLCSSAQRAVETLERVGAQLSGVLRESIESDLYLASSKTLLEYLREVDDAQSDVLLIAHNPGMASLAADLVIDDGPDVAHMKAAFPSAALAEIAFDRESWSQIRSGCGTLRQFTTPQDLG